MPYSSVGDSFLDILNQRTQAKQQMLLEALATRRADAQLKLQQDQETRVAAAQKAAQDDLEYNRRGVRAQNVHENALPGIISPKAGEEALEFGFGGDIAKAPVRQGAPTGEQMAGQEDVPLYAVEGGETTHSGGSKFKAAKQLATDKAEAALFAQKNTADIAAENRKAAGERNDADNTRAREIAQAVQSGQGNTGDLKRQILQLDVNKKTDEAKTEKDAKAAKLEAVRAPAQEAADVIDSLLDAKTGGLSSETTPVVGWGASIPGHTMIPSHATAISKIDRLKSLLVVDLMGQMKKQSRTGATGFGALSGPELKILENSAARLARTQTEKAFTEELVRLRQKLEMVLTDIPEAGATAAPGATGDIVYDMNGDVVK